MKIFDSNDHNKHVDLVLPKYQELKNNIVSILKINPSSLNKILWDENISPLIDNRCLGFNTKHTFNSNKCMHCRFFNRLKDQNKDFIEIAIGNEKGKLLKILYFPNIFPKIEVKKITNKYNGYIITDTFSNAMLSSMYISQVLSNNMSQYTINILSAFVCSSNGYMIVDNYKYNDINDIIKHELNKSSRDNINTLKIIFTNITNILYQLQDHGVEFLNIDDHTIKADKNLNIYLDITNGIATDVRSEDTKIYRLYPKILYPLDLYDININKIDHVGCDKKDIICYFNIDRCTNINTYRSLESIEYGSINIYLFMMMLMSKKKIYNIVHSDDYLYSYWKNLWHPDQFNDIDRLVNKSIFNILYRYNMRSDAIKYSYEYFN